VGGGGVFKGGDGGLDLLGLRGRGGGWKEAERPK